VGAIFSLLRIPDKHSLFFIGLKSPEEGDWKSPLLAVEQHGVRVKTCMMPRSPATKASEWMYLG
jgi:hypothetical protein